MANAHGLIAHRLTLINDDALAQLRGAAADRERKRRGLPPLPAEAEQAMINERSEWYESLPH